MADKDGSTSLTKVLQGLQTVARLGADRVPVVNLALSSGSPLPYQLDPLTMALDVMWQHGFTVVVPAGNDGAAGVASPGVDPTLLTAGSLNEQATADRSDDTVSDFSGRGPAPQDVAKPDLVAPGEHLIGLRAPGSVVDTTFPGSRVGDDYFRGSGTSMSTAVTSAAAADVIAARRDLTPDTVKSMLVESAYAAPGLQDETAAGAGGLDAAAALALAPTVADPTADDGTYLPPGDTATWDRFARAVLNGDFGRATRLWNRLSPDGRRWADDQWNKLSPTGRRWAQDSWAGRRWAGRRWAAADDGWLEKYWAALLWSGRRWAGDSWSGRRWADSSWLGRRWVDADWAGRRWVDDDWTRRRWSQASWEGRRWVDLDWLGRRWVDADWSADSWAGLWS